MFIDMADASDDLLVKLLGRILVSDPYFDQARHRYSYAQNNPATLTDPTGYILPAWSCGLVLNAGYLTLGSVQCSFGSYSSLGGGPMSWPQVRATLPDVTPDSCRTPMPTFVTPGVEALRTR
ncbi:hypothetical protein [Sorangium sp. So ce1389]|uniref:hypothetical protein n=1 Tax=Sorangium sp. So ce1389 TaxID=3133336 RepID=UPI003F62D372